MSEASEHLVVTKGITVQLGTIDNSMLATTTSATARQTWYIDKVQTDVQHMIQPSDVTFVLNNNLTVKELPEVDYYGEVVAEPWILGYGYAYPNTTIQCNIPQNLLPLPDNAIVHIQCIELVDKAFRVNDELTEEEEEVSPLLLAVSLPDGTFNGNVIDTTPSTWNKITGECTVHFNKPVLPNKVGGIVLTVILDNLQPTMHTETFKFDTSNDIGIRTISGLLPCRKVVPMSIITSTVDIDGQLMVAHDTGLGKFNGDVTEDSSVNYTTGECNIIFTRPIAIQAPVYVEYAQYMKVTKFKQAGRTSKLTISIPWDDILNIYKNGIQAISQLQHSTTHRI